MLLIADSGSTKTQWEIIVNGNTSSVFTTGTNPFYQTSEDIIKILHAELLPQLKSLPDKIFFYGAGISQPDKQQIVKNALQTVFPNAESEVEHDLLAAARATCGKTFGITCIIGTGSNTCLYDGSNIVDNVPNLGFILGDEGSGGYFGRKLLQAYFYREMPADLKKALEAKHDMQRDHVLNAVHGTNMPNQVVASYAGFLTDNNAHPYICNMLQDGFHEFLERHVLKYEGHQTLPIHFIGSIACLNQTVLFEVMEKLKLKRGITLKSPMEGLMQYHLSGNS